MKSMPASRANSPACPAFAFDPDVLADADRIVDRQR
jgi:hypothetical protein